MWICQIMTFPRVNSVFSFIFSEIPEVLLLKIMFFPSFSVKSQMFFCSKFCFSLHSQWNPRGSFAQNSSFPRNLGKNHTKSDQNQCPGNTILTQCHDKVSQNLQIQCSACKASFEKAQNLVNGDKMCVSHNNLRLEKLSFGHEFEQKKGNSQTSKHSISLTFIYFYYPKLDILQQ